MRTLFFSVALAAFSIAALNMPSLADEFSLPKIPPAGGPKLVKYSGWIEFKQEFRLYKKKTDIGKTLDKSCMSGYFFPKEKHSKIMAKFNHKKVVVYGSELDPHVIWNSGSDGGLGSPIDNYCGGDTIILGLYIELAK